MLFRDHCGNLYLALMERRYFKVELVHGIPSLVTTECKFLRKFQKYIFDLKRIQIWTALTKTIFSFVFLSGIRDLSVTFEQSKIYE